MHCAISPSSLPTAASASPPSPLQPVAQVAAVNTCAVVWNVILSLLSHAKVEEAKPVAAARGAKAGKK